MSGLGETDSWVFWRFRNGHEPLGDFGERLWRQIFKECGLFYVQLSTLPALSGKGPRLQNNGAILPDFDVSGQRRAYVDSKCKSRPVLYKNANEMRHGIDSKCSESYEAISGINRQKCILAICEVFQEDGFEWSGSLLMQTLSELGRPIPGFSNQDHMVYWPRRKFREIGVVRPLELWRIANGTARVPDAGRQAVVGLLASPAPPIQSRMF